MLPKETVLFAENRFLMKRKLKSSGVSEQVLRQRILFLKNSEIFAVNNKLIIIGRR